MSADYHHKHTFTHKLYTHTHTHSVISLLSAVTLTLCLKWQTRQATFIKTIPTGRERHHDMAIQVTAKPVRAMPLSTHYVCEERKWPRWLVSESPASLNQRRDIPSEDTKKKVFEIKTLTLIFKNGMETLAWNSDVNIIGLVLRRNINHMDNRNALVRNYRPNFH